MAREKIMLTTEQVTRLIDQKDDIEWLTEEIRRAELVGIDITDLKTRITKMKDIRVRMLKEYGNTDI